MKLAGISTFFSELVTILYLMKGAFFDALPILSIRYDCRHE
ncbi:hypothetical protein SAMN04487897_102241 [Paenibacillus sp. yr247]|nr:hypothetical protein SAMN04487897_102241 [Paenibacillus sp. yr247]